MAFGRKEVTNAFTKASRLGHRHVYYAGQLRLEGAWSNPWYFGWRACTQAGGSNGVTHGISGNEPVIY